MSETKSDLKPSLPLKPSLRTQRSGVKQSVNENSETDCFVPRNDVPLTPKLRFKEFEGNWKKHLFSETFDFSTGKNIKQKQASPEFEIPCVRYGELYHMYNEVIYNLINKTNLDKSELLFSKGDEILLPSAGEDPLDIGSASALTLKNVAIGRTINILRPMNEDVYSQIFTSYYINQKLRKKISTLAKGSSISNVYNSDLKTLKINLPTLPEQQKIASFLSAVDEKIQQLSKKKELLEDYKKGVMQQLFSQQLRFKQSNGEAYPDWEEKRLGEVVSIFNGYAFSSSDSQDSGCRWIKIADVGINEMKSDTISFLPEEFIEKHPKFILKKDDFVIALTRPILNGKLKIARIDAESNNSLLNQRVGKLESSFYLPFTYYLLQLKELIYKMDSRIAGTDPPNLSPNEINGIKLNISTKLEEQQKIATYLSSVDTKIESVAEQIEKTKEFKKGLLQQMFV
jgi:type I restriction enzyme S subunit